MRQPAPAFQSVRITEQFTSARAGLQKDARKQLETRLGLLIANPAHPSLRTKPVKPDKHFYEARLNRGDRIIYIPDGATLVLVDIVVHDDIDQYGKRRDVR